MNNSPLISVITPSFNQAAYIEATLRSVLEQDYPRLEHIVIDGGSTDGSVDIIRRYADHLAYWVSEKDRGQSDALNKGFARATGDVLCWLNSDDTFTPDALRRVAQVMLSEPETTVVYGDCNIIDSTGQVERVIHPPRVTFDSLLRYWIGGAIPPQPAVFFRAAAWRQAGPLQEGLHYAMDYALWLKMAQRHEFHYLPGLPLANYRFHHGSKTDEGWAPFEKECRAISEPYWGERFSWRYRRLQFERFQRRVRGVLKLRTRWHAVWKR